MTVWPVVVTGCGVPRVRMVRLVGAGGWPGQPGARNWSSLWMASTATAAQGARSDRCRMTRRAVWAMLAGMVNRRSRSRLMLLCLSSLSLQGSRSGVVSPPLIERWAVLSLEVKVESVESLGWLFAEP